MVKETDMSEATQGYLELESEGRQTNPGFQSVLNYIRERATSEYRKGELFRAVDAHILLRRSRLPTTIL